MDDDNTTNQGLTDTDDDEELDTDDHMPTGEDDITEGDVAEEDITESSEDVSGNVNDTGVFDDEEPLDDEDEDRV